MSSKVNIDSLSSEIMNTLNDYANLTTDNLKDAVQKTGTSVKNEIQSTAPVNTGKYAKSWSVKKTRETSNSLEVTVYSKNRYQLAHLLEYGHAKRGGGRVEAKPHIEKAEQTGIKMLEEEITRSIRNG